MLIRYGKFNVLMLLYHALQLPDHPFTLQGIVSYHLYHYLPCVHTNLCMIVYIRNIVVNQRVWCLYMYIYIYIYIAIGQLHYYIHVYTVAIFHSHIWQCYTHNLHATYRHTIIITTYYSLLCIILYAHASRYKPNISCSDRCALLCW